MNPTLRLPLILVLLLAGCAGSAPPRGTAAPAPQVLDDAAARCVALAGAALPQGRITEAMPVADGVERAVDPDDAGAPAPPLPAHCRLRGLLDERRNADGEAFRTAFELRLPVRFSGRLLHQGSDGLDGRLRPAYGRATGAQGFANPALAQGFAVLSNDGGHPPADPAVPRQPWGHDASARIDQAWRAHQRAATVARELLRRFYGRPAARHYVVGCGEGGRQGLMFAQRFPALVDGVVAVSPSMRAAGGAAAAAAWAMQQLAAVAPRDDEGRPRLPLAFGERQLQRVADEVLDRCDAADGLRDGLVQETTLCRIDPRRLRCPEGGEGCLSGAQASALTALMGGPQAQHGEQALYFGFPWDPGIAAPGWRDWMLGGPGPPRHLRETGGLIAQAFASPPDATLTPLNFDFERDPRRLLEAQRLHGTADDAQLDAFLARGGRLLLVHGMADPVNSALETVDYQRRVELAHGPAAAARFVRSFLVPGMNHCAGGPATDRFDALSALVDWVEQGRAPERIEARGSGARAGVSRPLCPYPRIARYLGSGDPSAAASFECR